MTFQSRPSVAGPTGTLIGGARVDGVGAARQAVRRVHGDCAHAVIAQMLLHFGDEVAGSATVRVGHRDAQRTRDLGQAVGEDGVDDDPLDLDDLADVLAALLLGGHASPGSAEGICGAPQGSCAGAASLSQPNALPTDT